MFSSGQFAPLSNGARAFVTLVVLALVLVRVPAIVQPPGHDQGIASYLGQRLLAGDVPYRDAWDQAPPAIHATYALMWAAWPDQRVIPVTDLLASLAIAGLLMVLGRRLADSTGAGVTVGLLYLLLANPAVLPLGGIDARAGRDVFIGVWSLLALLAWQHGADDDDPSVHAASRRWRSHLIGGACLGVAALYNYAMPFLVLPAIAIVAVGGDLGRHDRPPMARLRAAVVPVVAGTALPVGVVVALFAWAGALTDLWHATVTFQTLHAPPAFAGVLDVLRSLTPGHDRSDALVWMGLAGAGVTLGLSLLSARHVVASVWLAATLFAAIVGAARGDAPGLVLVWPPLALSAGLALAWAWQRGNLLLRIALAALVVAITVAATPLFEAADALRHDGLGLTGRLTRTKYLERFSRRNDARPLAAAAVENLAAHIASATDPDDRVLLFGSSPHALVLAGRVSASRFFWSQPVVHAFLEGTPGYGVGGLLQELWGTQPAVIVLERTDGSGNRRDSFEAFVRDVRLRTWLGEHYTDAGQLDHFALFARRQRSSGVILDRHSGGSMRRSPGDGAPASPGAPMRPPRG